MSDKSKIEWTEATWNPVRGCTKISAGCKNCYAETFAERFRGVPGSPFEQGFDLRLVPEKLGQPLLWRKARIIFVNSMSDLFHKDVPSEYVRRVCDVMLEASHHRFQTLTKRSERMAEMLKTSLADGARADHIWWGVSVEDKRALSRVEHLRSSGAKNTFLSVEPLLEDLGVVDLTGIGWVIAGGESGPWHRPIEADWVRSLRDQCDAAGVPFFFKQWGGSTIMKKRNGRLLDGVERNDMPQGMRIPLPLQEGA